MSLGRIRVEDGDMEEGSSLSEGGYSSTFILELGLVLFFISAYHHGSEALKLNEFLSPSIAFAANGGAAAALMVCGYWLGGRELFMAKKQEVVGWTVGGLLIFVAVTAIEAGFKTVKGGPTAEPLHGFLLAANFGALAGFVGGYFKAEASQGKQVIKDAKDRMDFTLKETDTGLWVWNLETDSMGWDDTMYDLLGVDKEDFDGSFDDFLEHVHPEDRESLREKIEDALEDGGLVRIEHRVRKSDGSEAWMDTRGEIYSEKNEEKLVGISTDITDQKEKERELRRAKERLDLALKGTSTGVWEWNLDKGEVEWNETVEEIFGIESREFEGTLEAFKDYIHPEDREREWRER